MLTYNDAAAEVMWHLITHDGSDGHGYSQYARYGNGTHETIYLSDGTLITIVGGDRDCSSAAIDCYESVGVSCGGAYYTENMEEGFLGSGNFVEISPWEVDNGDVLLRKGHTEMVLRGYEGELYQGGFRISELGTIYGDSGDQTGWESTYSALDPSAWTQAFRYAGPERTGALTQPTDESEDKMECIFRPNGENYLMYYDGTELHPLHHPDEVGAINKVYQATHGGRDIPQFELGAPGAPWATRFANAVQRKAEKFPVMA